MSITLEAIVGNLAAVLSRLTWVFDEHVTNTQAILAAWASTYIPRGERILAVADSNVAADNICVP